MVIKALRYIAIGSLIVTLGCNNEKKSKVITSTTAEDTATSTDIYLNQVDITPANDVARLLAGKATDKYADIQEKDYYKDYANSINQQWKENIYYLIKDQYSSKYDENNQNMKRIKCEVEGTKIIMIICSSMNNYDVKENLAYSFRYVNKFGFFVASHMKDDFNNRILNGTLHLILYTLAMKNCNISSYRQISLDNVGNVIDREEGTTKNPYGYEIKFYKDGETRQRTLCYLRLDASNTPMSEHLEFAYFIKSFPKKTCYLKSASYLLQDVDFTIMRKIITDQCDKIVQDESGLAYSHVVKDYDVRLYGTYTPPLPTLLFRPDFRQGALC